MFDTVNLSANPSSQNHHIHHEYRAATDESVKILREMEKEAQKNVVAIVPVKNTAIDATIVGLNHYSHGINARRIMIKYKFNGSVRDLLIDLNEPYVSDPEVVIKTIYKALSEDIASYVLADLISLQTLEKALTNS